MAYASKKKLSDNSIVPLGSNLYGTCSTANSTATKTVVMPDFNVLVEGVTIHVYFAHENTASNPKLKVGSTDAKSIYYNGQADGSWEAGGFISFTYYNGSWHQNDITVGGVTYTFSINDHTMTISGSDGSTQTVTIPDTTYTLSKSGSTVTLTGSDGSTTSVSDADTKYGLQLQNGKLKLVEGGSTSEITLPDNNTTYTISISGHTITLTPSSGTAQSVTVPDNNTTYTISKSGSTVTLTGSDGSTSTFTDANTTYTAGAGLSLSGTEFSAKTGYTTSGNNRKVQTDANGNLYVIQKDDNTTYTAGAGLSLSGTEFSAKTGYTTSGNNRKVQTDSNGNLYVIQKDDNTTYSAGTGLSLSGTTFNHSNSVTAVDTESLLKVKYDAQGHVTGSSAVAKADITALGIPGSDTNTFKAFYGTCSTAAGTATKDVTLAVTTGWQLVAGTVVGVKFTNTNTAQNPKLNINGTGAKNVYVNNAVLTTSNLWYAGEANRVHYYMYDGSQWVFMGHSYDYNTNTTYTAGTGLQLSGTEFSAKLGYTTSGNNRAVLADSNGNLYVTQKDNNTTYTAGTGLSLSGTEFSANLGYTTSGNNRAVLADANGKLYVTQKDDNTDTKVAETNTTTNADYRVLFSETADDTTHTEGARKNTNIRYNPSVGELKVQGMDSVNANYKSINSDVTATEIKSQNSSLTTSSADTDWHQALVKAICVKYPNRTNTVFRGYFSPNSARFYEIFIYDTSVVHSTTKLPRYSYGRTMAYGGGYYKYGTDDYVWRFANVDTNTTYSAGTGLSLSGTQFSVKTGYTTSGNNRKVQADSSGNLYVVQKDDNTTYSAGTGLSLSGTTFSVKTGYTTSGNNRKVEADSSGNLFVVQKDTWTANSSANNGYVTKGSGHANQVWATDASGNPGWRSSHGILCYCNTYGDVTTNITATNTYTKTNLTAPLANVGTPFTLSNGSLVCKKAGLYLVSIMASFNPATSGDLMGVRITGSSSGSFDDEVFRVGGNYDSVSVPMRPHTFTLNETVTVYVRNNSAGRGTCTGVRLLLYYVDYD